MGAQKLGKVREPGGAVSVVGPVELTEFLQCHAETVWRPPQGCDLQSLGAVCAAFFCPECLASVFTVFSRLERCAAVSPFRLPPCLVAGVPSAGVFALLLASCFGGGYPVTLISV
jgi:hypothetical protein